MSKFEVSVIVSGILVIIGLIAYGFSQSTSTHKKEVDLIKDDLKAYNFIVVNGETYNTDMVKNVEIRERSYNDDVVTLTLNDGTKILVQVGSYTFKNT